MAKMKLTGRSRGFVVAVLGERRRAAKTGHRAVDLPLLGPILLGSADPQSAAAPNQNATHANYTYFLII